MPTREGVPAALNELLADFDFLDRTERTQMLLELADRFREVPPEVASRPYPEEHRVQKCESQAYVWAQDLPDGRLKFHFAVENPQGISAKAMAVILDEALSDQPLEEVARVPSDIIFDIFGREVSMGKGEGLSGIVSLVTAEARRRLAERDEGNGAS
ncbi:MAG TPA: SufE family protein [Dehalococcoidia bacterium]|nr:SufE family protein [Dehalococcoidia bacterium]